MDRVRGKKLVLAVLGALTCLALSTASASAQEQGILTADGPVTLTGIQESGIVGGPVTLTGAQTGGTEANSMTALGGTLSCPNAYYKGYKYNATPHGAISSGSTVVTLSPTYGKCTVFGKSATIDMNGCDYVLTIGGTKASDAFELTTKIVCPEGKDILVTMFDTEEKHSLSESFCKLQITEKGGAYEGLTATDNTNGLVNVGGTVEALAVDESSQSELCAEAETEAGELHFSVNLSATNTGAEPRDISISDGGALEWDETSTQGPNRWTTPIGTMTCDGSVYTGHAAGEEPLNFIESGATSFTLTPHYSAACIYQIPILGLRPVTVTMNGCDYLLEIGTTTPAENENGTYGLTTGVACPEGQAIETIMYKATATEHTAENEYCRFEIDSENNQELSGLHLTDLGNSEFEVAGSLEALHEEHSGTLCGTGTGTSNSLDIEITYSGHNELGESTELLISDE